MRRVRGSLWGLTAIPLLVIAAFGGLAAVAVVADQTSGLAVLDSLRSAIGQVIGKDAATATLQAVATGLVTVTSITFSVLLLAVQQTASNLSPVVFDQFLRGKSNQAFVGFFVGLVLFSYVVMAAVKQPTPPILGAAFATVLTVVALFILLGLVFSTIQQMRPTSVIRAIGARTLQAREGEVELVRRTRRSPESPHSAVATYRSERTGYLTEIDLDRLERALAGAEDAEIVLHVTIGDHVSFGQVVADVRDGDEERARAIAGRLAGALRLSRDRNLALDATTGVDEPANIAWTSGSTAKQNPETAREALLGLQDLAMRWLLDDPVRREGGPRPRRLAVVYRDNDVEWILDALYAQLVVSHESHQHMLAAAVLDVYRVLLGVADGDLRERPLADAGTARPMLDRSPPAPALRAARQACEQAAGRP
jgi:uncharacterized membrane protein